MRITIDGTLEIHQGNTLGLLLTPRSRETGEPIVPQEGDKLVFTARAGRKNYIEKTLTAADYDEEQKGFVLIVPADEMEIPACGYLFDCLYVFADGRRATFPEDAPRRLQVLPAISHAGGGEING